MAKDNTCSDSYERGIVFLGDNQPQEKVRIFLCIQFFFINSFIRDYGRIIFSEYIVSKNYGKYIIYLWCYIIA